MVQHLGRDQLVVYTHGDLRSWELDIARALAKEMNVRIHEEPLSDSMFDIDFLKRGFERSESALFPEWLYAGMNLGKMEMKSVSAGVYGEILGGHYGVSMLLKGKKKALANGVMLLDYCCQKTSRDRRLSDVETLLKMRDVEKPDYLSSAFWDTGNDIVDAINEDIAYDLQRLRKRGVNKGDQLVEAFISEHRGSQYISTQILNCRATLDVTLPYAKRTLVKLAAQLPLSVKFGNSLNRAMLQKFAPRLLQYPTAAMLISAGSPIAFQEASRFCRRTLNQAFWKFYFLSRGRVGPLRTGWANFEYLRGSQQLVDFVNDLQCDIWDKKALNGWLSSAARFEDGRYMLLLLQPLFRIYSVDLMLRN
jgi:hypothetical protein